MSAIGLIIFFLKERERRREIESLNREVFRLFKKKVVFFRERIAIGECNFIEERNLKVFVFSFCNHSCDLFIPFSLSTFHSPLLFFVLLFVFPLRIWLDAYFPFSLLLKIDISFTAYLFFCCKGESGISAVPFPVFVLFDFSINNENEGEREREISVRVFPC